MKRQLIAFGIGCAVLTSIALMSGCASVHIKRITPSNDESADGLRFYRPRPYLVLSKQVPIAGGDFFVMGTVNKEKNVVNIDASRLPPTIRSSFAIDNSTSLESRLGAGGTESSTMASIPFGAITNPPAPTSGKSKSSKNQPSTKPTTAPTTKATTQSAPPSTQANIQTSNEAGDPLLKLNDLFSITYLPDFDENYVVSVDSGIGTGSADLAMKYGWLIENAKWNVDNRQIGQFLFSQIETAETIGLSFLNPLAGAGSAANALSTLENNATVPVPTRGALVQTPVTQVVLRIRYVIEAEPGLYPILKPGESTVTWWKIRKSIDGKTDVSDGKNPDSEMDAVPVLVPIPPYTVAAFNYQKTIAIELVNVNPNKKPQKPKAPTTQPSSQPQ